MIDPMYDPRSLVHVASLWQWFALLSHSFKSDKKIVNAGIEICLQKEIIQMRILWQY